MVLRLLLLCFLGALPGACPTTMYLMAFPIHRVLLVEEFIVQEALYLGVAPHVALGVAWRESKFNPQAIGPENANGTHDFGLFQLNEKTVRAMGNWDPLNATLNTIAAVSLLKSYQTNCGAHGMLYAYAHGRCPHGAQ